MALIERKTEGDKITCLYKSSNLLLTEYYLSKQMLEITFRNGQKYRYHVVNPMEHAGLQLAESAGQYFHRTIKTKRFEKIGVVDVSNYIRKADNYIT